MSQRDEVLATLPSVAGERLAKYAELLVRWQATINLVAPSTLPNLWTRHIGDSIQVQAALPAARVWVDLGSGGGFPGLVTAILLADIAGARVHLVESDKRKAAFLRAVARETGAPALVHARRIEDFVSAHDEPVDAISARALASVPRLLVWARKFLEAGAIGVFSQGETAPSELTDPDSARRFSYESVPSRMRNGSSLLIVRAETANRAAAGD